MEESDLHPNLPSPPSQVPVSVKQMFSVCPGSKHVSQANESIVFLGKKTLIIFVPRVYF